MRKIFNILSMIVLAIALNGCVETVVYRRPAPPPPEIEVITTAPYYGAIWIPGYWQWHSGRGQHNWRKGHWDNRHSYRGRDRR